jgi:hypothetical protein
LEFLEQRNEVPEAPSEAVKSPHHQDVEPTLARIGDQSIEGGTTVFGARDAAVHYFLLPIACW